MCFSSDESHTLWKEAARGERHFYVTFFAQDPPMDFTTFGELDYDKILLKLG